MNKHVAGLAEPLPIEEIVLVVLMIEDALEKQIGARCNAGSRLCSSGRGFSRYSSRNIGFNPFHLPMQIKKVSARSDLGRLEDGHDLMEKRSKDLSGVDGTDCGTVAIKQNLELARKYALHAFW